MGIQWWRDDQLIRYRPYGDQTDDVTYDASRPAAPARPGGETSLHPFWSVFLSNLIFMFGECSWAGTGLSTVGPGSSGISAYVGMYRAPLVDDSTQLRWFGLNSVQLSHYSPAGLLSNFSFPNSHIVSRFLRWQECSGSGIGARTVFLTGCCLFRWNQIFFFRRTEFWIV
jgi:hypothetical protein